MGLLDKNKPVVKKTDAVEKFVEEVKKPELPSDQVVYMLLHGIDEMTLQLDGETTVKSVNGQLVLTPEEDAKLQALIKKGRPDIVQNIRLLDTAEAERVAKAFLESQQNQRAAAARGASSSADKHRAAEALASDKPRNLDVVEVEPVTAEDTGQGLNGQ